MAPLALRAIQLSSRQQVETLTKVEPVAAEHAMQPFAFRVELATAAASAALAAAYRAAARNTRATRVRISRAAQANAKRQLERRALDSLRDCSFVGRPTRFLHLLLCARPIDFDTLLQAAELVAGASTRLGENMQLESNSSASHVCATVDGVSSSFRIVSFHVRPSWCVCVCVCACVRVR